MDIDLDALVKVKWIAMLWFASSSMREKFVQWNEEEQYAKIILISVGDSLIFLISVLVSFHERKTEKEKTISTTQPIEARQVFPYHSFIL